MSKKADELQANKSESRIKSDMHKVNVAKSDRGIMEILILYKIYAHTIFPLCA
jgi:hypothetical protein